MSLVRHTGKPTYFIRITTNINRDETKNCLNPGEVLRDLPDICAKVFKIKYDSLMDDSLEDNVLGKVVAYSATIG